MSTTASGRRILAVGELAVNQRGLITTVQLDAAGIAKSARRKAAANGQIVLVRRGVYRLLGAPDGWETRVLAAVLGAGSGADAVASHATAARLWRLLTPKSRWWSDETHLTVARLVRLEHVQTHRRDLSPLDRERCRAVPVTSVPRILLDLVGAGLPLGALAALVDEALRRDVVTLARLSATVARQGGLGGSAAAGISTMRAVLGERGEGFDPGANPWELAMDRMWEQLGLPCAERQYWIATPHGRYRPDRAIVGSRVAVDWNGYHYHGRRSRFDFDSDRRGHMVEAGWLPLDFTSHSTPEHVCRTVQAAVAQRPRH